MKNDKFPTTNMLLDTIKTMLSENMNPLYLREHNLQINLLGELIDNGYDVLRDVSVQGDERIDLLIRLSDGYMPIEICVNPQDRDVISGKVSTLAQIVNGYKDIRNGYFICLLQSGQTIFDNRDKLLHNTNSDNILWWGGRVIQDNDDAISKIGPIWTREKLKVYGLRRSEQNA